MKTYVGISRDHSGSMRSLQYYAMQDYNECISIIRDQAVTNKIDTVVSVVECGVGPSGVVRRDIVNSSILKLNNITHYPADGGATPLFDSVGELITILESVPDAHDPNVAFVVQVITDGQENSSKLWSAGKLSQKIRQLQSTDRWTFTFRVPRGYRRDLEQLGIPGGNILEWDQTEQGFKAATIATRSAIAQYYTGRASGMTMTQSFYQPDLMNVSAATVASKLVDVSNQVKVYEVRSAEQIRPFVERVTGKPYVMGSAYYQLTKKENEVQDYKRICIRDKQSGAVYSGVEARNLLGLPHFGTVKVKPGDHGKYDIFIQSSSVNRKLVPGTLVLVWEA